MFGLSDQEKRARKVRDAYAAVFNTPQGRIVLEDMMKANHVLGPIFDPGSDRETTLKLGERNSVLRILSILAWTERDIYNLTREVTQDAEDVV